MILSYNNDDMKLNGSKKILLLGMILVIVAGIVVVALKGFNVSLMYEQHQSINVVVGKKIDINEINNICKEVFGNKKFTIREIDFFEDSANINVESITDEEKNELVTKINEKYSSELTVENLKEYTISNVRIRDLVRPYIKPVVISCVIIIAYIGVRFRKMNIAKLLGKLVGIIALVEAFIASCVAIARIPVSPITVNLMTVVAVVVLIVYTNKLENSYEEVEE